jgi:D-apiose dehydrogenase
MKNVKGVMIGAGYFARFQAEAWGRISGVELAAVADVVEQRAEAFAAEQQIPRAYARVEEMLDREKPDFVDIVTRPESHLALTRLAAERGIHVICQKPMAPTWEDCLAMTEACDARTVRLLIHENWRWQPWFREVRRLLDAGRFGAPFYAGFVMRNGDGWGPEPYPVQPYFRQMPRLLVYEMVVHFLDTFRYLVGEIESVHCRLRRLNPVIQGEDCMLAQFAFAGGAAGLIDANRVTGRPFPSKTFGDFTLEGEQAKIRVTPQGEIFITDHGRDERTHEFVSPEQGYKGDSVYALQEHFVSCLRTGRDCESEGREYLKTFAAVLACYESHETGRIVVPKSVECTRGAGQVENPSS